MLIECLTKRDGPTIFNLHGFKYTFSQNEDGRYVSPVNSREHREYLLSMPDFREYQPAEKKRGDSKRTHRRSKAVDPG
jgi:hypothetical protein